MAKESSDKVPFKEAARLSLRGYKIWWQINPKILLSSTACNIVDGLAPYVGIYLSARIINEIAGTRDPHTLAVLVLATLISVAMLMMASAGLMRWKNSQWASIWHAQNKVFTEKLLSMDFASVDDPHIHDLRSQIWQNTNSGAWGLYKLLFNFDTIVKSIFSAAGAVALTVTLFTLPVPAHSGNLTVLNSPLFIVLIIALMLAVTFVTPLFSIKAGSYWVKLSDEHKMGNRLFSFWLGTLVYDHSRALDIRIYRQDILSRNNQEKFNPFSAKSNLAKAARGPMGGLNALSGALSQVFIGLVYVFVCLKALGGAFGVGSVAQYVASVTALSAGVSSFISTLGDMRNNAAFLRTTYEFLDIPNDMYQGSLTVEKRSDRNYDVEFRNVSFKYPNSGSWALRNVSIRFRVGERLAVVGQNGSGKTTFIKLLCRLYDPTEGEILLNGIDIRKYNYGEYMSIFSVVFQDFRLLSFPLGQNVAAKVNYDCERVNTSLDEAGFGDRFRQMPNGADTWLYKEFDEKGVEISGGEAQKIALARALYKDAPLIVLDEPTAALDPIAEYEVYTKFNEIVGDKTAVYISHRLSSCRFCDNIIVFDEGSIVQKGCHEELVAAEGKYNELWHAQAQYYTNDCKAEGEG
jgi:ATP-binding cassette, subfamily B, bacterial